MRILVVEDDAGIAAGLQANLQQRGYAVDWCETLAHAWAALQAEAFDAVLLDLGLPDGDGGSLLQRLRQASAASGKLPHPDTPVLIMTAREEVQHRIAGLNLGADDYLVKPFEPRELVARVRSILRRYQKAAASEPSGHSGARFCGWHFDLGRLSLTAEDGREVSLSAAEAGIDLAADSRRASAALTCPWRTSRRACRSTSDSSPGARTPARA